MSLSATLADANILISRTLRDYFVYAAKLGALDIYWSDVILDETTRNLIDKSRKSALPRAAFTARETWRRIERDDMP